MKFETLRKANIKRNDEVFSPCNNWSLMEWACAMAGEAGEVCGAIKKLRRLDEGTNSDKDSKDRDHYYVQVAHEMADVIIYLDLMADKMGIDLGEAVKQKFNQVSDRMKATVYIEDAIERDLLEHGFEPPYSIDKYDDWGPEINVPVSKEPFKVITELNANVNEDNWVKNMYLKGNGYADVSDKECCTMNNLKTITHALNVTEPFVKYSQRGFDWINFSMQVLKHIENYTVPQYGDAPDDQIEKYSIETCLLQVEKYINRYGKVTEERQQKDFLKMAHYLQCAAFKHANLMAEQQHS